PWWGYVVSLPNHHALHHSVEARDARTTHNYAEVLILLDVLFGTFRAAPRPRTFGVDDRAFPRQAVSKQLLSPFVVERAPTLAVPNQQSSSPPARPMPAGVRTRAAPTPGSADAA